MGVWVGGVLLLVGLVFVGQALSADRAVRRWEHARGAIREASRAHLADDGRQFWNIRVAYRTHGGDEVARWVRRLARDPDRRIGEPVDVWYDPHHPERSHVVLGGSRPGAAPLQAALGALLAVAGAAVLAWVLR